MENSCSGEPLSARVACAICFITIEVPVGVSNSLLGRQDSMHAERLLNQVRRPVQTVDGLDARLEAAGALAVRWVAQDGADSVAETVDRQLPDRDRSAHPRPLDPGPDP